LVNERIDDLRNPELAENMPAFPGFTGFEYEVPTY
jgi:hypothetical protein